MSKDDGWFEPRGISYLFGVIVRVKVVFRKTATTTDQSLQLTRFDDQLRHDKTDLSEPRAGTNTII